MTELYIDGTAVVLSKDFSTEIKIENSFFTKNGEYTYDIVLSLKNPVNATLYEHLNRFNSSSEIKEKRQAILVCDNRVYVRGTEIITDWDCDTVTIQLASGNSELNYLIGSDMKISSLDLGRIAYSNEDSGREALFSSSIEKSYPDTEYVAAPIFNRVSGSIINHWQVTKGSGNSYSLRMNRESSRIAQPYICTIIRKIIQKIGYQIRTNQLESSVYKNLFIVHANPTDEFAKMLPGWTVKDFLEELENLFNIVLVVNNKNKSVDIIFANQYYAGAKEVHLKQVEDSYEVEVDDENRIVVGNANVRYDLPENIYYKAKCLSEDIINLATRTEQPSYSAVKLYMNLNKPAREIVTDTNTGREYIYKFRVEGMLASNLTMVNEYKMLDRNTKEEIKLSMLPVEMMDTQLFVYDTMGNKLPSGTGLFPYMYFNWTLPVIDGDGSTDREDDTTPSSLNDIIENGETSVGNENKSNIFLAFYGGKKEFILYPAMLAPYPLSFPDNQLWIDNMYIDVAEPEYSLRLEVLDRCLYTGIYHIDTTRPRTIYTYDPNLPDIHGIFVVNNKRFVCKEMIHQIDKANKVKRWKAVLYPIRISDTGALNRWILIDGRWRDGGVWIDNGRWLDS